MISKTLVLVGALLLSNIANAKITVFSAFDATKKVINDKDVSDQVNALLGEGFKITDIRVDEEKPAKLWYITINLTNDKTGADCWLATDVESEVFKKTTGGLSITASRLTKPNFEPAECH